MSNSREQVKTIIFDAAGTVIEPNPPVWEVYAQIAARHGGRPPAPEVLARAFVTAFRVQEKIDQELGWRTDEAREEEKWRAIVNECELEVDDFEACFADLYAHFARPEAWMVLDGVGDVLSELSRRGHIIGIGSNFDSRLRGVVAGLPELAPVTEFFISSEIGWRKPSEHFFTPMKSHFTELLFVGDDLTNDYHGAKNAGLSVALLDPKRKHVDVPERIESIRDLLRI